MLLWHIRSLLGRELDVTANMLRQVFEKNVGIINNLDIMQTMFLMELKHHGTLRVDDLKRVIGTTDEQMCNVVQSLVDRGYIATLSLTRGEAVVITDNGKSLLEQIQQALTNTEEQMLAGLSEEDKKLLFQILKQIQSNCATGAL